MGKGGEGRGGEGKGGQGMGNSPSPPQNIFGLTPLTITVCPCWPASTTNQSGLVILTLKVKVVSESRGTWATSVPVLVLLGLSVLELQLHPMYTTDRRQTKASLNTPAY